MTLGDAPGHRPVRPTKPAHVIGLPAVCRETERMAFSGGLQDFRRIKANQYADPILDRPESVEICGRLEFRE